MIRRLLPLPLAVYCVAACAATAPAIPFKQDTATAASALPGGALGVLLISALAIVVVYFARKRLNLLPTRAGAPKLLRVLETQRLGPRALLSVVEFAGGQYLIAQGEQGITCLAVAPGGSMPVAAPEALQ
jgi:flagellar biogenesis protein FliO